MDCLEANKFSSKIKEKNSKKYSPSSCCYMPYHNFKVKAKLSLQ